MNPEPLLGGRGWRLAGRLVLLLVAGTWGVALVLLAQTLGGGL